MCWERGKQLTNAAVLRPKREPGDTADGLLIGFNRRFVMMTFPLCSPLPSLGLISVLFTYPLELIRVRTAFKTRQKGRVRLSDVMRDIYYEGQPPPPKSATTAKFSRKLLNDVSFLKFYRGFSMTMIGIIPYAGTSFLIFEQASKSQRIRTLFKSKGASDLFCGGMAGAIGQTAAYPFEVIRRRMQVGGLLHPDRFVNFNETCALIYKQSGYRGFFVGLSIGYLKVIPMNAISFATYNFTKRVLFRDS